MNVVRNVGVFYRRYTKAFSRHRASCVTSFLANSISVVAQIKLFEFKFLCDVINIYLYINRKMDWSGDNRKLLKLLLRKVIKFVPHFCGLSPKVQNERWQRVTEEFFADDFAIHLKEIH